jgi:hypothetical protein
MKFLHLSDTSEKLSKFLRIYFIRSKFFLISIKNNVLVESLNSFVEE